MRDVLSPSTGRDPDRSESLCDEIFSSEKVQALARVGSTQIERVQTHTKVCKSFYMCWYRSSFYRSQKSKVSCAGLPEKVILFRRYISI